MLLTESLWSACFSGYRGDKFRFSLEKPSPALSGLERALGAAISRAVGEGYTSFYCGVAWGFDILAGEAVLRAKERDSGLLLRCAVPWPGHTRGWGPGWLARYRALLEGADERIEVSPAYSKSCFYTRNRYMVDRSSLLICYYDGQPGGTAYTVKYAARRGLQIVNLAPEAR